MTSKAFELFIYFTILIYSLVFIKTVSPVRSLSQEELSKAKKYLDALDDFDEDWVDPHDMLSSHSPSKKISNVKTKEPERLLLDSNTPAKQLKVDKSDVEPCECLVVSNVARSHDSVFLSRWIKKLLVKMKFNENENSDVTRIVKLPISNSGLQRLANILNAQTPNMNDVEAILVGILSDATITLKADLPNEPYFNIDSVFDTLWRNEVLQFMAVVFASVAVAYIIYKVSFFPRTAASCLVAILSVCWQWMSLYKHELARKAAKFATEDYDSSCGVREMGILGSISMYFKSYFVTPSNCERYFQSIMVDPFWEVTPAMAISACISHFVLMPLDAFGQRINSFLKALFYDLPYLAVLMILVFFFILLLMTFKYRIRFPFFLGALEPSDNSYSLRKTQIGYRRRAHCRVCGNRAMEEQNVPAAMVESTSQDSRNQMESKPLDSSKPINVSPNKRTIPLGCDPAEIRDRLSSKQVHAEELSCQFLRQCRIDYLNNEKVDERKDKANDNSVPIDNCAANKTSIQDTDVCGESLMDSEISVESFCGEPSLESEQSVSDNLTSDELVEYIHEQDSENSNLCTESSIKSSSCLLPEE